MKSATSELVTALCIFCLRWLELVKFTHQKGIAVRVWVMLTRADLGSSLSLTDGAVARAAAFRADGLTQQAGTSAFTIALRASSSPVTTFTFCHPNLLSHLF
jgi:hypothetical protein